MNESVETAARETPVHAEDRQLHTVEEVFDRIDNKFIHFYGEYGRKIVNTRRTEWNQDNVVNLKLL